MKFTLVALFAATALAAPQLIGSSQGFSIFPSAPPTRTGSAVSFPSGTGAFGGFPQIIGPNKPAVSVSTGFPTGVPTGLPTGVPTGFPTGVPTAAAQPTGGSTSIGL